MSDFIEQTRLLAEAHALKFEDRGQGHIQISGHGVVVNYWPNSKKRTVFNDTTGETIKHCQPWDAIKLCLTSAKPGIRPKASKIVKDKQAPHGSQKPVRTNPAGIKHFYTGKRPPWDFPGEMIMCQSDRLRLLAYRAESRAIALRAKAEEAEETQS